LAWPDDDCVAAGADLEPATVVDAYRRGAFPMPHGDLLLWWSPLSRGVLHPEQVHVSRSLHRSLRGFTMTVDRSFAEVVDACADPARPGAWIDRDVRDAYVRLHELGWAHSVETRDDQGRLVGGLYGLAIGDLFAGESMFHHVTDASKAAMVELARRWTGGLIDVQWSTPHLASMGVTQMPRDAYLRSVADLVDRPFRDVW
jgi:leucyl/phenylalanyl-tRNA--protein transferase